MKSVLRATLGAALVCFVAASAHAETPIAFGPRIEGIPYYVAMRQNAEKASV